MWKNYIILSFRNLMRNKTSTFIHVVGLSIGLVSALFILFYVNFERSYEDMHENAENIYRVTLDIYDGNEFVLTDAQMYPLVGEQLKAQMPEVKEFVRMFPWETTEFKATKSNIKGYVTNGYFVDETMFDVFTVDFIDDREISKFSEPFKIIINETIAYRFFGKTDVVGDSFTFPYSETPLEVVGVMKDIAQNTHIKFNYLISHSTLPKVMGFYNDANVWNGNNEYLFLLMNEGIDLGEFNKKLEAYTNSIGQIQQEMITAEPVKDIHLYSNKTYEPEVNGSAQTVNFMFLIGVLVIVLAWINYINLSTAKAMDRAKEVGIRKTIGSSRSQLIFQFLSEAFLVNLISGMVALLLFTILLPYFKNFTGLDLSVSHFGEIRLFIIAVGILLLGTVISGFYPALVLSGFKPISILKGRFSNTSKGVALRKGLVYVQFAAAVVLLCVSMAVYQQMDFLNSQDLGVNIDNSLVIQAPENVGADSLRISLIASFESQLRQSSLVHDVTMAGSVPGFETKNMSSSSGIYQEGEDQNQGGLIYYHDGVQPNYPDVMGLEFLAGAPFSEESPQEKIVINEKSAELLGFSNPEEAIGQKITFGIGNGPAEINGVVKNFHQRSPKESFMPLMLWKNMGPSYFILKFNTTDTKAGISTVEKIWEEVFPGSTFEFSFLSDIYTTQYHQEQQFGKTVLLFTFLSLVIAGLGLFGLTAFMVQLRTKEIGVRTVLGASKSSLVWILSRDFMTVVMGAGLIALPMSYYFIDSWLDNYSSRIPIGWQIFVFPMLFILIVAMVTVGGQTLKSALQNPIKSLKDE